MVPVPSAQYQAKTTPTEQFTMPQTQSMPHTQSSQAPLFVPPHLQFPPGFFNSMPSVPAVSVPSGTAGRILSTMGNLRQLLLDIYAVNKGHYKRPTKMFESLGSKSKSSYINH